MKYIPLSTPIRAVSCGVALALVCSGACQGAPASEVEYTSARPIGAWNLAGGAGAGATAGAAAVTPSTAGNGAVAGTDGATAGVSGLPAAGASGAAGDSALAGSGAAGDGALAGSTGGAAGTAGTGAAQSLSSLAFHVTTKSQNGRYAPDNIGAIWIANAAGQFVKTLEVWALVRARYLTKWNGEALSNRVDAISGATLPNHKTHDVSWNLRDASGNPAPPGAYRVVVEVTDQNSTGSFVAVDFDTSAGPTTITPADAQFFTGMQLVLQ
jgi:hypothetical protein